MKKTLIILVLLSVSFFSPFGFADSFKPVWEQVDTLVCEEQVEVEYKKDEKDEIVKTSGMDKSPVQKVIVFDFNNDKIHILDAYQKNEKRHYSTFIYKEFKTRGDIIIKSQSHSDPFIKIANDYIFGETAIGETAKRFNYFNISYKDDKWVMLGFYAYYDAGTNEEFNAELSKYYCRSEDGFIEELGLNSLF